MRKLSESSNPTLRSFCEDRLKFLAAANLDHAQPDSDSDNARSRANDKVDQNEHYQHVVHGEDLEMQTNNNHILQQKDENV